MSVPLGDEDTLRKSSHMDRDLWHPFHLDNISYITKDKTSELPSDFFKKRKHMTQEK